MSLEATLARPESLGDEKMRAQNKKDGARKEQFGVRLGDIRKLAKEIKTNQDLAVDLWATGASDARLWRSS